MKVKRVTTASRSRLSVDSGKSMLVYTHPGGLFRGAAEIFDTGVAILETLLKCEAR
jgi:hypothetical protein